MPQIYAFGKATQVNNRADVYNALRQAEELGVYSKQALAQEYSNNPFGISYAELMAPPPSSGAPKQTGSSTSAAAAKPDRSNSIALQLAGLGSLDNQTATGIAGVDSALAKLTGQYDTETTSNEGNYTGQSTTNQSNLQKNKQTALVNASQGRQGLFGTLSSLGALSGDGINLANRAVQKGANDDLSGAADTFSENQQGLDTAIGQYRQEDKMRRENAETSASNSKLNIQNKAAETRMKFLSQLADDYSQMGNEGEAKRYAGEAAGLYPTLARTSVPDANLSYSGASFTPSTLANYIAGADSTQVQATPTAGGAAVPGLIASPIKKKQLQAV